MSLGVVTCAIVGDDADGCSAGPEEGVGLCLQRDFAEVALARSVAALLVAWVQFGVETALAPARSAGDLDFYARPLGFF